MYRDTPASLGPLDMRREPHRMRRGLECPAIKPATRASQHLLDMRRGPHSMRRRLGCLAINLDILLASLDPLGTRRVRKRRMTIAVRLRIRYKLVALRAHTEVCGTAEPVLAR
jgi:hypothetical protein